MRTYDPAELSHLASRTGIRARILVWIRPRSRATGLVEPIGFWNGDDDQAFMIGDETRTYHGAGALLGFDDLKLDIGLVVRRTTVWLATAATEVVEAAMSYDLRLAPVQVHRVLTDPQTFAPIAAPHRIWKGWADGAPRVTPAKGDSGGKITLTLASAAMALTRSDHAKYSDESMKLRGGDRLFRYADVSGKVPIYWGEEKYIATPPAVTPDPGSGYVPPGRNGDR